MPESHYLLALTYEQLNQDEESIAELLMLLKEADFNPEMIADLETGNALRDRDIVTIGKMKAIWAFWKKKTGNYLANKFFEDSNSLTPIESTLLFKTLILPLLGKFQCSIKLHSARKNLGIMCRLWNLTLRLKNS